MLAEPVPAGRRAAHVFEIDRLPIVIIEARCCPGHVVAAMRDPAIVNLNQPRPPLRDLSRRRRNRVSPASERTQQQHQEGNLSHLAAASMLTTKMNRSP